MLGRYVQDGSVACPDDEALEPLVRVRVRVRVRGRGRVKVRARFRAGVREG